MGSRPPVRPQDAAGLVLLRDGPGEREVLLGKRRRTARFLPGIYVFPGGRLEPEDEFPVLPAERFRPLPAGIDRATQVKAAALARAAVRETFEETGILFGRPGSGIPGETGPAWRAYAEAGLVPAFEDLSLIVRAITPAVSPIRYHTRFFLAEATGLAHGTPRDEELEDVAWVPLAETDRLPMVDVTQFVLAQALASKPPADRPQKAPLLSYRGPEMRSLLRHAAG